MGTKEDAAEASSATDDAEAVLGLVADPGLSAELVKSISRELPALLAEREDGRERWRVETSLQLLPLDEDGSLPLLDIGRRQCEEQGWDVTVLLTELPRRAGKQPVFADYHPEAGVGLVSLPALGVFRVGRRARDTIAYLVAEHLGDNARSATTDAVEEQKLPGPGLGFPWEIVSDSEERRADAEEGGGDESDVRLGSQGASLHLALPGVRGKLQLLTGMVRTNRPWRLVPSLSPALAGAAAGAAFGVFYSNIWQLADAFSTGRLILVNAAAVLAMIAWLIFDNGLWESPKNRRLRSESALYNSVTTLTVLFGVLCMYLLLYVVTLCAAFAAIPTGYLAITLRHNAGFPDLATIAWLSASMGTIAGALGSGLAGEDAVRRAAYSERELERQAQREKEEKRNDREATRAEENES
ncbi:hypothetical protein OKJ48_20980 [Streptomyces kunmingensis]|uniref:Uncharacterized protein n=1 Tax=Streptomyces kunmingensis TaxID=68225 RepID=A0ABU6CDB9_9ACTN|nr:hypothetical protein [Streptomyces kunmingensis]MEB3962703.1 hypothetical protein [Streptomyces kunmingensis]